MLEKSKLLSGSSFGWELIKLYKKTGEQKYLDAAVKIANTLVSKNRLR